MQKEPLVTVGVICYNAGEYIVDTLNSVYRQTYKNIEVILSDDCSTDDTVKKAQEWFSVNSGRFVRAKLITSERNTGTSANGNRAISQAQGEWYKSLDGDDILVPTAISDYISYIDGRNDVDFVFGRIASFTGDYKNAKFNQMRPVFYGFLFDEKTTAKQQYKVLIKHFAGSGSSDFYRLSTLKELGGFDERFPLMEDHPFFIKLTKNGKKMWLLDKITLHYRISTTSVAHSASEKEPIFTNNLKRQIIDYKYLYLRENYGFVWKLLMDYSMGLKTLIIRCGNSRDVFLCRVLVIILKLTDPYSWDHRFLNIRSALNLWLKKLQGNNGMKDFS